MSQTLKLGRGGVGVERLAVMVGGVTPLVAPNADGFGVGVCHSGGATAAADLYLRKIIRNIFTQMRTAVVLFYKFASIDVCQESPTSGVKCTK